MKSDFYANPAFMTAVLSGPHYVGQLKKLSQFMFAKNCYLIGRV